MNSSDDRAAIKNLIREVLIEMLIDPSIATFDSDNEWVPLKDAVPSLGYPSYKALHADVMAGLFRVGKEIRDRRKAGSQKPVYQINLAKANKRLLEDPSKRRSV